MTAPVVHPVWCDPAACSVALDPEVFELLHRAAPIVIDGREGTPLYVVLAQTPAAPAFIDLARLETPVAAPFWAQPPLHEIGLSLNDAAIVASALRLLVGQATDPRTNDGRTKP